MVEGEAVGLEGAQGGEVGALLGLALGATELGEGGVEAGHADEDVALGGGVPLVGGGGLDALEHDAAVEGGELLADFLEPLGAVEEGLEGVAHLEAFAGEALLDDVDGLGDELVEGGGLPGLGGVAVAQGPDDEGGDGAGLAGEELAHLRAGLLVAGEGAEGGAEGDAVELGEVVEDEGLLLGVLREDEADGGGDVAGGEALERGQEVVLLVHLGEGRGLLGAVGGGGELQAGHEGGDLGVAREVGLVGALEGEVEAVGHRVAVAVGKLVLLVGEHGQDAVIDGLEVAELGEALEPRVAEVFLRVEQADGLGALDGDLHGARLVGLEAAAGGLPEGLPAVGLDQAGGDEALLQALDGERAVALEGQARQLGGVLLGHVDDFLAVLQQARHQVGVVGHLQVLAGHGQAHRVALLALEVDDHLAVEGVDVLDLPEAPRLAAHVDPGLQRQQDGEAADDRRGGGGGQPDGIHHQLLLGGGGAAADDLAHLRQVDALQLGPALGEEVHARDGPAQVPALHGDLRRRGEDFDRALRVIGQLLPDQRQGSRDVRRLGVQQTLDLRLERVLVHVRILSTEMRQPHRAAPTFPSSRHLGHSQSQYQKRARSATLRPNGGQSGKGRSSWSAATGAKERRWQGQGPRRRSAARCAAVP